MKKLLCVLALVAMLVLVAAGNVFAPLVLKLDNDQGSSSSSSSSSDTSTVDLSDKDTSQPVPLLR